MQHYESLCFQDAPSFAKAARGNVHPVGTQQAGDPHLTLEWFALLAETAMPAEVKLALVVVSSADADAKSFLPLLRLPDQQHRLFGLSNFYSPLFGLVNETFADLQCLERLMRQLKADQKGYTEIRLAPMDTESSSYVVLKTAFRAAGWVVDDYFCFGNWYEPICHNNAEAYLAARPAKLRNTLQRAERRLAKIPGFQLQIHQAPDENLESAIADFVEVYRKSWKSPEPFPEFVPEFCRLSGRKGWLRLGVVRLANRPIAAQIWIVSNRRAQIVKLAYDKEFIKISAGTVLSAALFRHVIDNDQVREIDYLIGDDAYKNDWMSKRRERRGILAFNPGMLRGLSSLLIHRAGKVIKRMRSLS